MDVRPVQVVETGLFLAASHLSLFVFFSLLPLLRPSRSRSRSLKLFYPFLSFRCFCTLTATPDV